MHFCYRDRDVELPQSLERTKAFFLILATGADDQGIAIAHQAWQP
jgi:hypothetical protein